MNHVSDITPQYLADSPSRNVSLFRNGANQAVRIPKEFELPGKQATMRRVGNRLVIEAIDTKPVKGTVAALVAALESLKHLEPVKQPFPYSDDDMLPLDDIVL